MKKLVIFVSGALFALILGATALAVATSQFTDQDEFADWYKSAVLTMNSRGIMNGYDDGRFGPTDNVSRAQIAVMLKKFDEYRNAEFDDMLAAVLLKFMAAQERFPDYFDGTNAFHRSLIILAETGLRRVNGTPSDIEQYELEDFGCPPSVQCNVTPTLPEGYSIYSSPGIIFSYYVRYEGNRLYGDVMEEVDEWYGPF